MSARFQLSHMSFWLAQQVDILLCFMASDFAVSFSSCLYKSSVNHMSTRIYSLLGTFWWGYIALWVCMNWKISPLWGSNSQMIQFIPNVLVLLRSQIKLTLPLTPVWECQLNCIMQFIKHLPIYTSFWLLFPFFKYTNFSVLTDLIDSLRDHCWIPGKHRFQALKKRKKAAESRCIQNASYGVGDDSSKLFVVLFSLSLPFISNASLHYMNALVS